LTKNRLVFDLRQCSSGRSSLSFEKIITTNAYHDQSAAFADIEEAIRHEGAA